MLGVRDVLEREIQLVSASLVSSHSGHLGPTLIELQIFGHPSFGWDYATLRRPSRTIPPQVRPSNDKLFNLADGLRMPDKMSHAMGALVEPLSVAYQAVLRAKHYLGQPVLICGAGPIGLAVALIARASGAYPICKGGMDYCYSSSLILSR